MTGIQCYGVAEMNKRSAMKKHLTFRFLKRAMMSGLIMIGVMLVVLTLGLIRTATAQDGETPKRSPIASPLHPTFALLDEDGENVLTSGKPLSTMTTCGTCHDTGFIASHSFHSDVGLSTYDPSGETIEGRAWDTSLGTFGRWDPITYRYLSPQGDTLVDMTTAEWIKTFGQRHIGGGPAEISRDGTPLDELEASLDNVETAIIDPKTGELVAWDWVQSGTIEMNCFLCHTHAPNNEARIAALEAGDFKWSNSATLVGTGIVQQSDAGLQWNTEAFDDEGRLLDPYVNIQDPGIENCAQCHGEAHTNAQEPLVLDTCSEDDWSTYTTGQVIASQRIANSGLNLSDKDDLTRTWDVHAERVVECTDCHYSLNNPIYYQEDADSQPDHLIFDPRRIDFGDYLYRPLHEFAKGQSAQSAVAPDYDNTLRRCESCHSIDNTHEWLPYKDRHTEVLACETCHVPKLYAPALQTIDWTVLQIDGTPKKECRGVEVNTAGNGPDLVTGYQPVLLPRKNADGSITLAPHNLVTAWYWVYGNPERPVPLRNLEAVWLAGESYQSEILATFDINQDGSLALDELVLDSDAKVELIVANLEAQGLENPHIVGEIQPYSINHDVAYGEWATRDCQACHTDDSRITTAMLLSDYRPGGISPTFVDTPSIHWNGELSVDEAGRILYEPQTKSDNLSLYILGHSNLKIVDMLGVIFFLLTLIGISIHSTLRYLAIRKGVRHAGNEVKQVYMYSVYERQWHWLQTIVIVGLLFTGLIIHKPDTFGMFSFRYVVQVHNILAVILLINAALAMFYHLASGEIRQFLPEPHGFFNQAILQGKYYAIGIFKGHEHPIEKTQQRKMNPIQQVTYLAILNILLPAQVITGALMWGAQRWPSITNPLGGLTYLGPIHSMVAWLFVSFIMLHVYMTTTGHTPLANIKAMVMGWDELETHQKSTATGEHVS